MFDRIAVTVVALLAVAAPALAGGHTWDVNEIFSDPTGTIQFIELREMNGTPLETGVPGHFITSNTKSFLIPGPLLTPPTTFKTLLLATPACAAVPGFPTPDYIIPAGSVPFFSVTGDTISYTPFDTVSFVAGSLPTDGYHSLNRSGFSFNVVAPNSPKNYAGQTATVHAGPWTDVGPGLAGTSGFVPSLLGLGWLVGGSTTKLELSTGVTSAPAALFVGLSNTPTPFKGGLLGPVPWLIMFPAVTNPGGKVLLTFLWPTGLPSGLGLYFQYAIQDSAAVQGVSLSQCVKATTP